MKIFSSKNMVALGALFMLTAIPIGFFYGLHELGKGEASANYQPSAITQLVGLSIPVLFFGGLLLILTGIIRALLNRQDNK